MWQSQIDKLIETEKTSSQTYKVEKVLLFKSRWGSDSGSPILIGSTREQ